MDSLATIFLIGFVVLAASVFVLAAAYVAVNFDITRKP